MRPLRSAQHQVLAALPDLPSVTVPLAEALGLALREAAVASHPVPPFANSAMDGYAVQAADVAQVPVALDVIEDVPAGSVSARQVVRGTAIKIMTGAPLPVGADAVVRVEDTRQDGSTVTISIGVSPGTAVRPAGGDVEAGTVVVERGVRLSPAHIGVLANIGQAAVVVGKRPRVAVASTGDELVPVGGPALGPGQIRDSNRPMLTALLAELGAEVIDLGRIPDDRKTLTTTLLGGASEADVVITSGGVSMGEYDLVKAVIGELGDVDFWQVAMQPAKPFAFGRLGETPFFGLPGNPVSSFVAFEQFVRPALLHMMGSEKMARPRIEGRSDVDLDTDPEKTVFVRVITRMEGAIRWCRPSGGQSSNVLSAVASGDAFAVVEQGVGRVTAGSPLMLEMFRWPEERTIHEL